MSRTVRTRYLPLYPTTAPGTTAAAPLVTTVVTTPVQLLTVELRIPSGHAGLTGWRLAQSGQTIVPWAQPEQWIIGDDQVLHFTVDIEIGSGLTVATYNTDIYPHTFYCLFETTDLPDPQAATFRPLDIAAG